MGCRDVTRQQACTLYQLETSYTTRKRTSEDARFFRSLEVRYFEQPQHVSSQAAGRPPKVKETPASAPQPQGEVVVSIPLAELQSISVGGVVYEIPHN